MTRRTRYLGLYRIAAICPVGALIASPGPCSNADRPVARAEEHIVGQIQLHHGLARTVLLGLLIEVAGVLRHRRRLLLTVQGDDGAPILANEDARVYAASSPQTRHLWRATRS